MLESPFVIFAFMLNPEEQKMIKQYHTELFGNKGFSPGAKKLAKPNTEGRARTTGSPGSGSSVSVAPRKRRVTKANEKDLETLARKLMPTKKKKGQKKGENGSKRPRKKKGKKTDPEEEEEEEEEDDGDF